MRRNKFAFKVPSFSYPGGKVHLRKWLMQMMPREGETYIEPFAGRANVFWLAACSPKFKRWWLNDIYTAPFLRAISKVDLGNIPIMLSVNAARKLLKKRNALSLVMKPTLQFSGGKGGLCVSQGKLVYRNRNLPVYHGMNYRENVRDAQRVLIKTKQRITDVDYLEMRLSELTPDDFVYLDPPYFIDTKTVYAVDIVDHEKLANLLSAAKFRWLLSGFDNQTYRRIIGAPTETRIRTKSMVKISVRGIKPKMTECVWRNY